LQRTPRSIEAASNPRKRQQLSDHMAMTDDDRLRVVPQPIRRQVENGLREAIARGRFAPGEPLPDRMLCELFGASRPVVREAIRLLEAEGLVTVQPNRSPFVAFLSSGEAAQLYELRGALEALAGEGFALRASDEERSELRQVYEALAACKSAAQGDLVAIKRRFYDVLLRGCRNDYIRRTLEPLLARISQLRATSLSAPGRLQNTISEIGRVLEAVEQRDAKGAAEACRVHIAKAAETALEVLRNHERSRNVRGDGQTT
jgi:DNA-binding GntR family transcriptional regulator